MMNRWRLFPGLGGATNLLQAFDQLCGYDEDPGFWVLSIADASFFVMERKSSDQMLSTVPKCSTNPFIRKMLWYDSASEASMDWFIWDSASRICAHECKILCIAEFLHSHTLYKLWFYAHVARNACVLAIYAHMRAVTLRAWLRVRNLRAWACAWA